MKHDCLIINSYAGSLNIACHNVGIKIRGSWEDGGYGIDVQRANYPRVHYLAKRDEWPEKQDLSNTIVIAHPPCAAFSMQNTSHHNAEVFGVDAKKFQCTKDVIEYALKNNCAALAVESVIGALDGAREVHDQFADKYRYHAFRIVQNAITFAVPQWRERFWIIYMPRRNHTCLEIYHTPQYRDISSILDEEINPQDIFHEIQEGIEDQRRMLIEKGLSRKVAKQLLAGEHGTGPLQKILMRYLDLPDWKTASEWCKFGVKFSSGCLMILDPEWYANTVLCTNFWSIFGRALTTNEFKRIAGFPADYVFPGDNPQGHMRCYLSRGVAPPVAEWILHTIRYALDDEKKPPGNYRKALLPGEVIDLRIKRKTARERRQLDLFPAEVAFV